MQRQSSGIQGLVFGGLMAALMVVFSLVPVLSLFMPIPLVLVYLRYGGRVAAMTAVVSVLFCMAFSGAVAGIMVIPGGILPGLVFGYGFYHKRKPLIIGLLAVLVFFLGYAMTYGVTRVAVFSGRDPFEAALESPTMRQELDRMIDLIEQVSIPQVENPTPQQEQALQRSRAMIEQLRQDPVGYTWSLLPMTLFFLGVISTCINYLLCRITLPRFGHQVPQPAPFEQFRLPMALVWVYGILMLVAPFTIGPDILAMPWWGKLLLNVFTPLGYIIAFGGVAVVYGFLRQKGYSKGVAALIPAIAFLMLGQASMQISIMLAMWDAVFDFRHLGHGLWRKRPEGST